MPATMTRFEQVLHKDLRENADAMFAVALGDSHRHAFLKGVRSGLEKALNNFRADYKVDPDGDGL